MPGPAIQALQEDASTLALLGSGIALAATGPAPSGLLQIHMISFLSLAGDHRHLRRRLPGPRAQAGPRGLAPPHLPARAAGARAGTAGASGVEHRRGCRPPAPRRRALGRLAEPKHHQVGIVAVVLILAASAVAMRRRPVQA